MIFLIVFTLMIVLFDLVALRWGYDSSEQFESPEWERRRARALPGGF